MMVLMVMMISSCRTIRQNDTQYISRTDTVYTDKLHERTVHDSIYVNTLDSIFVDRYVDNNNVHHQDKTKYVYVTKYVEHKDTVYIQNDSIVTARDTIYANQIQTITKNESPITRLENVLKTLIVLAVVLYVVLNFGRIKDFFRRLFG